MNASFIMRFKAFIIDYILKLVYLILLFILSLFVFPSLQELFTGSVLVAQFTGFLMVTLPVSLYYIISDSVIGGQSFGKKKIGIRVVDKNGNYLSLPHVTLRTILKFFPWELSHFLVYRLIYLGSEDVPLDYYLIGGLIYILLFAYIFTAIFTKRKQSIYDILAKTQVINVSSN
ncbi:RDD family protein [Oceanobacillus saliphilus]|uniref:RDD family protein n=1 Tax=Oceanobacillus saliphilus TaxID=2925834 RepID=UPI00201E5551|nr:RDD family protein [Oceanobacillus saliphilus]